LTWGYDPPSWLPGGHTQTIYPALFAKYLYPEPLAWQRQRIATKDHDFIDIDWSDKALEQDSLIILFHGLEGDSSSHYARAFANHLKERGMGLCIPHFRGCSGDINLAPRAYHSGDFEEVGWILNQIKARFKGSVWAVGVSLGGNALLRWAQESGSAAGGVVKGIGAICAPLDLMQSGLKIGTGINRLLYERRFLRTMKLKALQKINQYPNLFDIDRVMSAKSLYEFDNYFTAPLHGFKNTDAYWQQCSSNLRVADIKVKHLVVNALNDPFIPAHSLPAKDAYSEDGMIIYTDQGGHVGFLESKFPGHLKALPELVELWMKS